MTDAAPLMPPFRAEVIGSLLRPRSLKDAALRVPSTASASDYAAVLEREIARVIARQEAIGFKAVTDGELARTSWFGFFFERMDGFRLAPSHFTFRDAEGHAFEWPTSVAEKPIRRRGPITLEDYRRAAGMARTALVKATMPAPSAFHFFRLRSSPSTLSAVGMPMMRGQKVKIALAALQ